ncbi:2, mitochondrial [Octopus vulgaris]|uniref:2, mitochondrial n=1 Tax=Octopus vulgaris TaxID=6645 RepID=A0AA36BIA4_OCTVU|nr:2, mitochondrial [Octopus vulgaris]
MSLLKILRPQCLLSKRYGVLNMVSGAQQHVRHRSRLPMNTMLLFVPQQEAWIIERFGKYHKILEPGLNLVFPVIDTIKYVQSLKEIAIDIPQQSAISIDNVTLQIDGVLYLRVVDAYKASYGVEDAEYAITQLAQTTMRSEIGKINLDTVFRERELLNYAIVEAINKAAEAWGIDCLRYEISIREADINVAEGNKQSIILASEANKLERINQAAGEAEAIVKRAKAKSESILLIANAIAENHGSDAVSMKIAEEYVYAFSQLAKTGNTVVVPANTNDISGMVTQALSIYKGLGINLKAPEPSKESSEIPSRFNKSGSFSPP